jgi:hypothetical protein
MECDQLQALIHMRPGVPPDVLLEFYELSHRSIEDVLARLDFE